MACYKHQFCCGNMRLEFYMDNVRRFNPVKGIGLTSVGVNGLGMTVK